MWGEENKEKQHYGDYLYMGNLEALPGFGEMGGGREWGRTSTGVWEHTCTLRTSNVAASSIFPACLYMIKPQLEAVSYVWVDALIQQLSSPVSTSVSHGIWPVFCIFFIVPKQFWGFSMLCFWCFGSFHPQLGVTHSLSMCQFPPIERTCR